ncbi:MAG: D-aminoacylase [Sphingomonas sp. 28-62-20]|uniref:N-acyl-D-amino-acid deacylase family protein n=1 Tax=Sphingomonas sp. 28-62-20 TaxID=1970433 RepID=UPI000BD1436A|nr:MAG: D-aminoacylase [Sphingomonas sp. 28-62-20]
MTAVAPAGARRPELVFRNASVVDGTGAPRFEADVGVAGDRIVAIGRIDRQAPREIDATGLCIAPGFIDAHTHDDAALLLTPSLDCKISQGVTSVVTGNCGVSLAPLVLTDGQAPPPPLDAVGPQGLFTFKSFAAYLEALTSSPPSVNVAPLVGHSTLRVSVMDSVNRPATAEERAAMAVMAEEAFAAGAIGISSGLFYPLAFAAPAEELHALVAIAGRAGGVYCAHIRDEADLVIAALDEAFAIARAGNAPLVLSHHKVSGKANFGRSRETLAHVARAATAQPIAFDMYPYAASSTMLNKKSWAAAERTLITWCDSHPEHAGRDLSDVAAEMGLSEEAAIDALVPAGGIYFMMDESDVERILSASDGMIGSDGVPMDAHPHPRLWGSFTRVIGHYARDRALFSIEEAIRRMTSLPARQFRLADRGVIAPGAFADLVLFDPATIADAATFANPKRPSLGIASVWVNGAEVWDGAAATAARPGRVLARA